MPPLRTFTLQVPKSKAIEVVVIQDDNGAIVARTADELRAGDAATEPAPRG
jgi:hypothetical protein